MYHVGDPVSINYTQQRNYDLFNSDHCRGGTLEAVRYRISPEQLHITDILVTGDARTGIAKDLIKTVLRSVIELPNSSELELVTANIINPVVPHLFNSVFGEGIAKYYADEEMSQPLEFESAVELIIARQTELERMLREEIDETGFDSGAHVVVPILDLDVSSWPLINLR